MTPPDIITGTDAIRAAVAVIARKAHLPPLLVK